MGKVQQQFFPDSSRPEPIVDLWLPKGSTVQQSEVIAKRVEARLMQEPGVFSHITGIGSAVPRFYLPSIWMSARSRVSQGIVLPKNLKQREELRMRSPALLATEFSEIRNRVKLLPNRPTVQRFNNRLARRCPIRYSFFRRPCCRAGTAVG